MKKTFFIVFLVYVNSNMQAQNYKFDLLTKYNTKIENYNNERVVYSNSKDENFFLYLINLEPKNAILYDFGTMTSYNFEIIESTEENELLFEFKYLESKKMESCKNFYRFEMEYSIINEDSLSKEIKVDFYKNSKRKKIIHSIVLKVKENNTNLFPLFRISCLHPYEFNQNINISDNIIVESGKGTTVSGKKIEYELLIFKEIDFEIQIPKNSK